MAQHSRKNTGPQVVTANRLVDGIVVYLAEDNRWVEALAEADFADHHAAAALLERANQNAAQVVEPYLFEIKRDNGMITALSQREIIRALGPTVRLDLGKQAEKK